MCTILRSTHGKAGTEIARERPCKSPCKGVLTPVALLSPSISVPSTTVPNRNTVPCNVSYHLCPPPSALMPSFSLFNTPCNFFHDIPCHANLPSILPAIYLVIPIHFPTPYHQSLSLKLSPWILLPHFQHVSCMYSHPFSFSWPFSTLISTRPSRSVTVCLPHSPFSQHRVVLRGNSSRDKLLDSFCLIEGGKKRGQ